MNRGSARWQQIPDLGEGMGRRMEELYDVEDAPVDSAGLIQCAVLPLRDAVLYPNMVTPLFVSHDPTLQAVESSSRAGKTMIAVAQRDPDVDSPAESDLYRIGTEVAVGRLMHLPDGSTSVLTQGRRRVEIVDYVGGGPFLQARARLADVPAERNKETVALMRAVLTLFEKCVQLNRTLPEEAYLYASNVDDPGWLADLVASALELSIPERQGVLETFDPVTRLQRISVLLGGELDVLELEDRIHNQVQSEVDRSQREMYLREQMKAIQVELGEGDVWAQEIADLRELVDHLSLPEEVQARALKEIQRLTQMPAMSPEVGIIRTYVDWLVELPWSEVTVDNLDVRHAKEILDRDHYGLRDAKDRILEYIAVRSLAGNKQRQPILCFIGPPGTGKTSIGRSIAESLGRKFIRISLGGIRDEAEIRGHRRTYIGALPGRILQAMRRAGSLNPLFMLDEIDKLGHDYRGDPSSALLEVLDPEQNHAFSDHYLELPFDLSKVLFVTTANNPGTIPPALLDRMEIIEFLGYIEEEKLAIARQFLVPRQIEQNGLNDRKLAISADAIRMMIREYTWEAGVRNLERELGKTCRRLARRLAEGKQIPHRVTPSLIPSLLGPPEISPHEKERENQIGTSTGLAWTENGGEAMSVEVLLVDGKGSLQVTGQVGEVMQESAQAALSYIKSRARQLRIRSELFEKRDIHIHIPEGAIPKDGPSAGITIATSLASALTGRAVDREVGMTGEITLRGRVLPVGGVREKVMAAYRLKLSRVILPRQNNKDLTEVPKSARQAIDIRLVDHMDDVLSLALAPEQPKTTRRRARPVKPRPRSVKPRPRAVKPRSRTAPRP
ncbi:MAG: endopeptidase La [Anaerolineales bacterium]|nr:endopeptidase La [Anaerolineales bacterium]